MPVKTCNIPDIGEVALYKRRDARHIKISLKRDGTVRVTLPYWVPYRYGVDFVRRKASWIQNRRVLVPKLRSGMQIGKSYCLKFIVNKSVKRVSSRVAGQSITVTIPFGIETSHIDCQRVVQSACLRALQKEAEALLPGRVKTLANRHGFNYSSLKIKKLKSRWGSCSLEGELVLNAYLVQLPWHLIDYVILHELTHTTQLSHNSNFWKALAQYIPNLPAVRKEIKAYQPVLMPRY